jgi:Domain of unknown function (DUF4129)
MSLRRRLVVPLLFLTCSPSIAELRSAQTGSLTVSEYIAQLDHLDASVRQLTRPEEVPGLTNNIPAVWRIEATQRNFEVSTEWLRHDLNDWQTKPSRELQDRIVARLQTLGSAAASFETTPTDVSQKRVLLNRILANQEFQDVHGPTWLDRLKQRLLQLLLDLLGRVFKSSTISAIGDWLVYGLMGLALLALAFWMYRTIRENAGLETMLPHAQPISSKDWKLWMAEARSAAESGNWRDAIHLGYWCGISCLEAQGLWRPDTARTPREYLRLLPSSSEYRETLGSLTRSFELVWYGRQEADEVAFSETLAQLEKLGCQSN